MRLALIYGIATGVATGMWMFAEYALGLHSEPAGIGRWTGFLALIFPIVTAYVLVQRDWKPSWFATGLQGIAFGASGGLTSGATIYAYFAWLNPDFAIEGQKADPFMQSVSGFVSALILGIVLVVIMRAIRKKGTIDDGAV